MLLHFVTNSSSKRRLVIWSSVGIAAVTLISLVVFTTYRNQLFGLDDNDIDVAKGTDIAAASHQPQMVLTVLKDNEDDSPGVRQFQANNTGPIPLAQGQHIRFESPDSRTPDSLKVVAVGPTGTVHILLKSYDVNNEFFINLDSGNYELKVQARWFNQTYFYPFNVNIT
jgi:hypothetical protein